MMTKPRTINAPRAGKRESGPDWRPSRSTSLRVVHLYPKIHLERCGYCNGTGRYILARRDFPCTQCAGRGTIVRDDA